MGEVYLAFDTRLQREVALKVLTQSDDASRRLTHEARLASRLTHPFICTVFEAARAMDSRSSRWNAWPAKRCRQSSAANVCLPIA